MQAGVRKFTILRREILLLAILVVLISIMDAFSENLSYQGGSGDDITRKYVKENFELIDKFQAPVVTADSTKRPEFYQGSKPEKIALRMTTDFAWHLLAYPQCVDWQLEGLCVMFVGPIPIFWPYISYYYPTQTFELTRHAMESEYVPKKLMKKAGNDLQKYWYPQAEQRAPSELKRVAEAAYGASVPVGGATDVGFDQIPDELKNLNSHIGDTQAVMEWRVFSTLAQITGLYPIAPKSCHHSIVTPIPYYSEMKGILNFARLGKLNQLLFLPEVLLLRKNFGGKIPVFGIGTNIHMAIAPFSPFTELVREVALPMISSPYQGPDVGTTSMHTNDYSRSWLAAMLKAVNFRRILPGIAPWQKYDGERKRSRYQWIEPRINNQCNAIGDSTSYGHFLGPDYHPEIMHGDEGRGIVTQWNWYRCCPLGFEIFVGPRPQIKW